jgi:hypothetical protein
MSTGKKRFWITVFCVAMLGWTQLAEASYACPQDAPKMTAIQSDCAGNMHQKPSMLCKAHCEHSSPSPHAPDVAAPALICMATTVPVPGAIKISAQDRLAYPDRSPPLRIQYSVFRI